MTTTTPRTHSRRRADDLLAAIDHATRAELEDRGYQGVTFDGVARRARTSKPVLYRRFPTRARLVAHAMAAELAAIPILESSGSLREDLCNALASLLGPARKLSPGTLRALLGEADPELMEDMAASGSAPVRKSLGTAIAAARDRGELGPAHIPDEAVLAPVGLLRSELLQRDVSDDFLDRVVRNVAVPLYTTLSHRGTGPGTPR